MLEIMRKDKVWKALEYKKPEKDYDVLNEVLDQLLEYDWDQFVGEFKYMLLHYLKCLHQDLFVRKSEAILIIVDKLRVSSPLVDKIIGRVVEVNKDRRLLWTKAVRSISVNNLSLVCLEIKKHNKIVIEDWLINTECRCEKWQHIIEIMLQQTENKDVLKLQLQWCKDNDFEFYTLNFVLFRIVDHNFYHDLISGLMIQLDDRICRDIREDLKWKYETDQVGDKTYVLSKLL